MKAWQEPENVEPMRKTRNEMNLIKIRNSESRSKLPARLDASPQLTSEDKGARSLTRNNPQHLDMFRVRRTTSIGRNGLRERDVRC